MPPRNVNVTIRAYQGTEDGFVDVNLPLRNTLSEGTTDPDNVDIQEANIEANAVGPTTNPRRTVVDIAIQLANTIAQL